MAIFAKLQRQHEENPKGGGIATIPIPLPPSWKWATQSTFSIVYMIVFSIVYMILLLSLD